ncbi:MAG TPA: hypothetical protein VKV24_03570 [Casimicrobiaceae bacterium]|nr:hypothetical protein [Casimicrobiaceae bacterium]
MATTNFERLWRVGVVRQLKFHGRLVVVRTVAGVEDERSSMPSRATPVIAGNKVSSLHDDPLLDECLW